MAKQKKQKSEEEIISDGLSDIRDGIINGSWTKVVNGYYIISGEKLEIPDNIKEAKKTKLQIIREHLEKKNGPKKTNTKEKAKKESLPTIIIGSESDNNALEAKINNWGGMDQRTVISAPIDPKEKKENEEIARSKPRVKPPRRSAPLVDESNADTESHAVRFLNVNKPPVYRGED